MGGPRTTLAKLSPPRIPAPATRQRLSERLDALSELPGVWVEGPAGSGKTTSIADYLNQSGRPQFWYHVDEGDRDPSALVSYLVQLAAQGGAEGPSLPYLTPEHLADLEGFARQLMRGLYQSLPPRAVVVIDNCHRAAVDAFHTILRVAFEEVPPGMWLVALSRHQLPGELVKLRANRGIGVIDANELVLDATETRDIVAAHVPRPPQSAEVLHRACGGWVAGLILLLNQRQDSGDSVALDLSSREALFQYFAGEIFEAADGDMRRLLLSTALLPVVTADAAREMSGNPHAEGLLDSLYRRHYFTSRRAGDPPVYSYHDLFRAFLVERLERDLAAGEVRALRAMAARQLERSGYLSEAIEEYRLLGDVESIARMVLVHAQLLVDEGRVQTLSEWLAQLPAPRIDGDPWLLFYQGVSISLRQPAEAKALLERAYDMFAAAGDAAGQFSAAFWVVEAMLVISATFRPWDRWIAILEPLLEKHAPRDPALSVRAWYAFLYMCLYRAPGHRLIRHAVSVLEHELFDGRLRSTQSIQAATGLLAYAHFASDEERAARVKPVLLDLLGQEHLPVFSRTWGTVWMGVYNFFDARYEEALQFSTAARELARQHGIVTVRQIMGCYRIQSLAQGGRAREALAEATQLAGEILPENLYPRAYLSGVTGTAEFICGSSARALPLGERCVALWHEAGFIIAEAAWSIVNGIYLIDMGRLDDAAAPIEHGVSMVAGTACNYLDPLALALRAEIDRRRGDEPAALALLGEALSMCRNRKRAAALTWARPLLPALFSLAWRAQVEPVVVSGLIDEWGLEPAEGMHADWPWPASIRTFGGFELVLAGQPHKGSRKTQRRLLELIKYLAVAGARGAAVDDVIEALWPDAEGDVAHGNFRTALFRARKLLGGEAAILSEAGRVRINPRRVWLDTVALEQALAGNAPATRVTSLYRGELLQGEDAFWILAPRRKWQEAVASRAQGANR